jgi:hypothetical protein
MMKNEGRKMDMSKMKGMDKKPNNSIKKQRALFNANMI